MQEIWQILHKLYFLCLSFLTVQTVFGYPAVLFINPVGHLKNIPVITLSIRDEHFTVIDGTENKRAI